MNGKTLVLAAPVALSGLNKLLVNQSRAKGVSNSSSCTKNETNADVTWNRNWQMNNANNFERHIYFIRNAHYEKVYGTSILSEKGKQQSMSLNTWISQNKIPFDKVIVSVMKRAKDTWSLINTNNVVGDQASIKYTDDMKECSVYFKTLFSGEGIDTEKKQNQVAVSSFEAAFRRQFVQKQAIKHDVSRPYNEMYVTHGNTLKFIMFRLLQLPIMDTFKPAFHGGIVKLIIKTDSTVELETFSGVHVMPFTEVTTSKI